MCEKKFYVRSIAATPREFGDLRNAIMHGYSDNHPLATPYPSTTVELENILKLLAAPPTLGATFRRTVFTCTISDSVGGVARTMLAEDYSQVPVYDETRSFLGLLNSETISRWMTTRFDVNKGILED